MSMSARCTTAGRPYRRCSCAPTCNTSSILEHQPKTRCVRAGLKAEFDVLKPWKHPGSEGLIDRRSAKTVRRVAAIHPRQRTPSFMGRPACRPPLREPERKS